MKGPFKPRLKVCYQTKSKLWPYKNSRLRFWFFLRSQYLYKKKLARVDKVYIKNKDLILYRHTFKRKNLVNIYAQENKNTRSINKGFYKNKYKNVYRHFFLAQKNMKWTLAKRFFRPFYIKKKRFYRNYATALQTKQQFKAFYGKVNENQLRNLFKKHLRAKMFKTESFLNSLENRVDMVLFRMRLLPTVYAAHQYVDHQGVYINGRFLNVAGYTMKIGDIVNLKKEHWPIFYTRLRYKLVYRQHGKILGDNRKNKRLKRLLSLIRYNVYLDSTNNKLPWLYKKQKRKLMFFDFLFKTFLNKLILEYNKTNNSEILSEIVMLKNIYKFMRLKSYKLMRMSYKNLKRLRNPYKTSFFDLNQQILLNFYELELMYLQISNILKKKLISWKIRSYFKTFKNKFLVNIKEDLNKEQVLEIYVMLKQWKEQQYKFIDESFNFKKHNLIMDLRNYIEKKDFLSESLISRNTLLFKKWTKYLRIHQKLWNYKKGYTTIQRWRIHKFMSYKWQKGSSIVPKFYLARFDKLLKHFDRSKQKERLKYKRKISPKHHFYIPSHLEIDWITLRAGVISLPNINDVKYPFENSVKDVMSFYKEKAL